MKQFGLAALAAAVGFLLASQVVKRVPFLG
jgi:hypothetical protein